jgi:hypothetical protein
LAAILWAVRFRIGLAAGAFAAVFGAAVFCAADLPAALAFLTAPHRFFVAAMIGASPSELRRRVFLAAFAGAGVAAAAATFRTR